MYFNQAPSQSICSACNPDNPQPNRPPVLAQCGHSMCIDCNAQLTHCHVCSLKYTLPDKVAVVLANLPEEKLSQLLNQHKPAAASNMGLTVCCDCWVTFDPSNMTVLGDNHAEHACVQMEALAPEMKEILLWVCQKFHKGITTIGSVKSPLQIMIMLTLEVQKAFWDVFGSLHSQRLLMTQLRSDFMALSRQEITMDPSQEGDNLLEALRTLRNFEVHMVGPILRIAQRYGPVSIKTKIEDSLIADFDKVPDTAYQLASINSNLLSKLPKLTDYVVRLDLSKPIFEQIENLLLNAKTAMRDKICEMNMKTLTNCNKSPVVISVEGISSLNTDTELELFQELEVAEKNQEKITFLGKRTDS